MDSEILTNRERSFSSLLHQERSPERYSQPLQLDHIQGRTYDHPRASLGTDRVEPAPLGTVPELRYNRIDLSPNSRPLLSQFRLSDHMPVSSLPRSLAGLSDVKKNVYNGDPDKNGLSTRSLIRGLSVNSSSQMDTMYDSPARHQSRAQSLLDLHKPFSPLETRTAMGSQVSLKSFTNQSPDMNTLQQLNRSYNTGMPASENQIDRSPPYNVFSYQSRKLNIPVGPDSNDRSRTVIVKSTLCYNTSTQTDIPYTDNMTDPSVGTPRMKYETLQGIEVTSPGLPKKIERYGRICEEKSVQTSQYRDVLNPFLDLKADSFLYRNNKNHSGVFLHNHDIMHYGMSSCGSERGQTDISSYNSDRKHSGNYIRQSSYEFNRPLESSQKNQTRYASHDILNEDILHHQSTDNSFINAAPVFHNQQDEDCLSKHGMISRVRTAAVLSRDTPTNGNRVSSEATRCVKNGTDSNNNECSHHKTHSDLYHFSDYGSTTGSLDSRHIPAVFPSAAQPGSLTDSHGYSSYTPEAFISKSRSSSQTIYDHFEGMSESAFFTSPMSTDPGMKVHNLSLTSGVGSEVSSTYSYPRSPPLDSSHDTTFTHNQQSFSHAANNTNISPTGSSTFQWKKIVILNPDHIKTSRRDSDSVFIDEDDVEHKYLLYKDFRQKTFPVEVTSSLNKLTAHAFPSEGFNQVRSNADDPFKSRDRAVTDQCVPPSPKSRVHRISESLNLGQIQEETEILNAGMDKSSGLTSRSENIGSTSGISTRCEVEKCENQLYKNETWLRDSFDISSGNLKQRRSEPFVEAPGNLRRYSLDSAKLQRNGYQGGDNSLSMSAFRNYIRNENSTPTYYVPSSQDLVILRRESDLQITKQQLQKLQATHRQHSLRSTINDLKDLQNGRQHMPIKCYEGESSSSSSTLQDISSLDNSLASIRNSSVSETVAELIVKVNENLTKSAERMVRIRRSSSNSSRNSLDFIDTTRPERGRRETDWTRIRSMGSLRSSPERDHWLNWSSFASDYLNDDTGILTSSTPRSSFALSRDKEHMLEASSLNASMDSGLVVSPIYQNFPTKRRPPPPPRPAGSSGTEPPPLPPRMNRENQPSLSGTQAAEAPEPTQYHISGKEKHRIEVIPLGKPQDEDIRVDTSKMNFKDLMMQWKNNSPRDTSSPSDLRRHEQKLVEKHQPTGKVMSSVPTTFERNKTTINLASTYRQDPAYSLDATSPVFSPVSSVSTLQSSPSKSAFSTSPPSSFGALSESSLSSLQYHHLGSQPSALNNTSNALYPGFINTSCSSLDAPSTNVAAYTDDFSSAPASNSGIKVTLVNQNQGNTGQTPPIGKISFLTFSRSRSSSDLLSDPLAGNVHSPTAESAPVKLHRLLRDRSSSHHDILSDKPSQGSTQYQYHFRSPHNGGDFAVSKSPSSENAQAKTLRSPREKGIKSTPIANGRLSNSTLALSNGYGVTDHNLGFADESYIGHKNKSSRTVGTYKRSVSAVGVQPNNSSQGKSSCDSDSAPFRDFSLGQQSWNSESLLTNAENGVKTLPEMGSQFGKAQKDGVQSNQGYTNGVSNATPVRPPRPNARGRQNAKQSSATSAASSAISSSGLSQKTKLTSVSLSALDSPTTSASFSVEQGYGSQQEKLHRSAAHTPSSPPYDHNFHDQWPVQQGSNSSGTPTASGQDYWSNSSGTPVTFGQDQWLVQQQSNSSETPTASNHILDRSPVNGLHHSHYSPQHRQLALNNSLNSTLSRASLDDGHPQSMFIQDSTATPLSPCSPSEQIAVNRSTKDHQRKFHAASGFTTSPTSLENSTKILLENPTVPAHYQPDHTMNSPRETSHKSSSTPTLNHLRQPSQEEIECDEKALELAEKLDENDQKLLEVLKQDRANKRMLYMEGLFSDLTADQEMSGFKQKSRSSMKNRTLDRVVGESYDSSGGFKSHSLPRDYQQTTCKAGLSTELLCGASNCDSDTSPCVHENLTVLKHKEELVEKLHKKILVLKDEKLSLQQEIADNILLGQQVCQVADSRCQSQNEKEKFMTFIDDLEKIVRLLLNLSGQLARAENAVQALGPGTDAKLKKLTWDKREKLHEKHEEAKMLKEAIDRRSEQLLCMLQERLSSQELSDYKHFINMKSRLTIQMQEVDDYLALAEQQVIALRRSLPASVGSFPEKNREA